MEHKLHDNGDPACPLLFVPFGTTGTQQPKDEWIDGRTDGWTDRCDEWMDG